MPTHPCPNCPGTALRYLPASSAAAMVNYYRCDGCGHVFAVAKAEPDAQPKPITIES